jgi:hypothetical protein
VRDLGFLSAVVSVASLAIPFVELEAFKDADVLEKARNRLEHISLWNIGGHHVTMTGLLLAARLLTRLVSSESPT